MGKPGCLAFGCFRTVWFNFVLGFASTCVAQEKSPQTADEPVDNLTQQLADFFGGESAARDLVEEVARQQTEALVDDVAQQLADFFRGEPAPTKPPARRIDRHPNPAPPRPTPARDLPGKRDPGQGTADDNKGAVETLGPFRFVVPEGWAVSDRHEKDGPSLVIGHGGANNHRRYVTFLDHPGMGPTVPYTPEAISEFLNAQMVRDSVANGGRSVVESLRPGAVLGRKEVGQEKYRGAWSKNSVGDFVNEIVLFGYGGKVYMLSAGYHRGDKETAEVYQDVIRSIRPADQPNLVPDFSLTDPLPDPGYVSDYLGLRWNGKDDSEQCVWAARQFAERYLDRTLPRLGKTGGAAKLFRIETPGFQKIPNSGSNLPQPDSLIVWGRSVNDGTGHVAVMLDTVDPRTRTVRVIDSNWGNDRRGQIHDVRIGGNVQGWLVAE